MKKTKNIWVVLIVCILLLSFMVGCKKNTINDYEDTPQHEIYQKALLSGYDGTYEDWLETIKGIDGTSITNVIINDKGELIVSLSNGKEHNLGVVKGSNGSDGVSIINVDINNNDELIITYSDQRTQNLGKIKGTDGKEVELQVTSSNIEWRYQNETLWNKLISLDQLKGEQGKSAYDSYIQYHPDYKKTEEEWIMDLINGALGSPEAVYYNVTLMSDNEIINTMKIASGSTISSPSEITKEDYELAGWYYNNDAWRFNIDIVTKDITLEAKWNQVTALQEVVVPRYQGMSIESLTYQPTEKKALRAFSNHTIKDIINDYLDIETTERVEYYANKGDKFNIVVHLYNPSSYEILSFTLNDYKYQSYEFKEGSNSTELIIEVDAGLISGIKEYTIDAIKYIDKTEIKDVQMDGEKTVKAGIKYDITPSSSILQEEILTTSYKSIIEVKDDARLIDVTNGLYFFLYEENTIVKNIKLSLGLNSIEINNLYMGKEYGYMVIGVYDDCSGNGKTAATLSQKEFTTLDGFLLTSETSDFDSVSLQLNSGDQNATIKSVNLYDGTNLVEEKLNQTSVTFSSLLSNHDYLVEVVYTYTDANQIIVEKKISKEIKTLEKLVPSIVFGYTETGKDNINYTILESDIDNVRISYTVSLYQVDTLLATHNLLIGSFDNLLSNNEYIIKVNYQYDLNDGNGVHIIEKELSVVTKSLKEPTVDLTFQANENNVSYEIKLIDDDQIFNLKSVRLLEKETTKDYLTQAVGTFNNLTSNTEYIINITYEYNLNDGLGTITKQHNVSIKTLKKTPSLDISSRLITHSSIDFIVIMNDPNSISSITKIELMQGENLSQGLNDVLTRSFSDLNADSAYSIKITYVYDLDDGQGSQTKEKEYTFKTHKQEPVVVSKITTTKGELNYDIDLTDPNSCGSLKDVKLVKNNLEVGTNKNLVGSFSNLLSNNEYQLLITYQYDINDGNGIKEKTKTMTVKTVAKQMPTIDLSINKTDVSMSYTIYEIDSDQVANFHSVKLYDASNIIISSNTDDTITQINELVSNTDYKLVVEYTYDLNDGKGLQTLQKEVLFKTLKTKPKVEVLPFTISQTNINFFVNVTDFGTGCEVTTIGLYKDKDLIQRLVDLSMKEFYELSPYTDYEIRVTYTYDLSDGSGIVGDTIYYTFNTLKNIPIISYTEVNATKSSIDFNISIDDLHQSGKVKQFNLYYQNQIVDSIIPNTTLPQMNDQYLDLYSNSTYKLGVVYEYDLADGKGVRNKEEIHYVNTISKEIPDVTIDNLNTGYDNLTFTMTTTNNDLVGITYQNISLFDNNTKIKEFTPSDLKCNNLLSNHSYMVEVVYQYDLNDNSGAHSITKQAVISTKAYDIPKIMFNNKDVRFNKIEFSVSSTDTFELFKGVSEARLYLNSNLVETLNTTNLYIFSSLLTGSTYNLEVSYQYDLRDGQGVKTTTYLEQLVTPSKEVPKLSVINTKSTEHSVSWDYDITDIDNVGLIKSVSLDNISHDISTKEVNELVSGQKYILKVIYEYDLNDGNGLKELVITKALVTQVEPITVTQFELLNTNTLRFGQDAHVRITFDNPSLLVIDSFYVNGIETTVSSQTDDYAILKFIPTEVGEYEVTLTSIKYTLLGEQLEIDITSPFTGCVNILGEMRFIDFYFEEKYVSQPSAHVIMEFDNPYDYDLYEVENNDSSSTDIEKIDSNHFRITADLSIEFKYLSDIIYSFYRMIVDSFTYGTPSNKTKIYIESTSKTILHIDSPEIINISTVEELQMMTGQVIYSLQNDIDLKGVYWQPYDFRGILLGNGHTISNLTMIIESNSGFSNVGLFESIAGSIENIHLADIYYYTSIQAGGLAGSVHDTGRVIDSSVTGSIFGSIYVGGISGSNSGIIDNCYTNIAIKGDSSVGGLVGFNNGSINNCYVTGSIKGNDTVGGLVGLNYRSITNCYVTGSIKGDGNAGGLVGFNDGSINNSYVTGSIEGKNNTGGLVGCNDGSINNSYVTGSIKGSDTVGGFVADNLGSGSINNSYVVGSVEGIINTGGFVVNNRGFISNSYVTGSIDGTYGVAGFARFMEGDNSLIKNCFVDKIITEKYPLGREIVFIYSGYGTENCYIVHPGSSATNLPTLSLILEQLQKVWDLSVWDFENLNEANCPTLKK